jgi:hypothetical protein
VKLFTYVLICAFAFSYLDWKVVHYTRLANREWLEWMHAHERQYAFVTRSVEFVLCAPALALKPLFYMAAVSSEASQEEQDAVLHADKPTWRGFYHLPVRGQSWTYVSWVWWFLYWLPISLLWWRFAWQIIVWRCL